MKEIVHKQNFDQKRYLYLGFGHETFVPTVLCNPKAGGVRWARYWKHVTCKNCLRQKVKA